MHTAAPGTCSFAISEVLVLLQHPLALQFTDLLLIIGRIPSVWKGFLLLFCNVYFLST